jgi:hypothetical protein
MCLPVLAWVIGQKRTAGRAKAGGADGLVRQRTVTLKRWTELLP